MEQYGRYQLLSKLATGGMAQVFLARPPPDSGFGDYVVLKRILPHLAENEEFLRMFLQEARVAARLAHPNVAQTFDLGEVDGSFYLVMEYVHGEDVRRIVREAARHGRSLPLPLACRIVIGASHGLAFAHDKCDESGRQLQIVHRDVSPQNILVGFDGVVKVIDFGVAKAADSANHTRTGVLKGKYSYMSPEQAGGRRIDRRSDVFALGVVLWELVTGQRLFRKSTDLATVQAVTACQVPRPSDVNSDVPPELDEILLRALAKDPAERTGSATEFALQLEEFLTRHRLPGTQAHLAAFLHEIYAERLDDEAGRGRLRYEENLDVGSPSRRGALHEREGRAQRAAPASRVAAAPPSGLARGATRSLRSDEVDHEATTEGRARQSPLRSLEPPAASLAAPPVRRARPGPPALPPALASGVGDEVSRYVRAGRGRKGLLLAFVTTAVILLAAAALVYVSRPGALGRAAGLATLRISSEPSGAEITLDERPTGRQTPADLAVSPGRAYVVSLRKPGYLPVDETIPPFQDVFARTVRLEKARVGALKLDSTPPGARIVLEGRDTGLRTPALLSALDATRSHRIRLSLDGYDEADIDARLKVDQVTTVTRTLRRTQRERR